MPDKIWGWIVLSALALLLLFGITRLVITSSSIKEIVSEDKFELLRLSINRAFLVVFVIATLAAVLTLGKTYLDNLFNKELSSLRTSQDLLHEWAYIEDGQRKVALETLKNSANTYKSFSTYMMLANALSDASRHEEAVDVYQKALRIQVTKEGLLNIGMSLNALHRYDEAQKHLSESLELDNDSLNSNVYNAKAHNNLAGIYYEQHRRKKANKKELAKALEHVEKGLELVPSRSGTKASLLEQKSLVLEALDRWQDAAKAADLALALKRNILYSSPEAQSFAVSANNTAQKALEYEGGAELAEGFAREAIVVFEASGQDKYLGFACFNLAIALSEQGKHDEAVAYAEKSLRHFKLSGADTFLIEKVKSKRDELVNRQ